MIIKKVAFIFAVFFCTNSYGGFYKCTDAKGNVTYSNSECKSKGSQSVDVSEKIAKAAKTSPIAQPENAELQNDIAVPLDVEMQKKIASLKAGLPKKVLPSSNQQQNYHCDGRTYCSQMTSCAEAMFFLKNCPDTKMDGGRAGEKPDGIPCESQWCN